MISWLALILNHAPKFTASHLLALKRIGEVNPLSLTDYEAHGGYAGLRKALTMTPEAIIEANKSGEILGRGGAMFPLGLKAEFVRNSARSAQ